MASAAMSTSRRLARVTWTCAGQGQCHRQHRLGDFEARGVGGSVKVERHGSGDVTVRDVGGDLTVVNSGSGDITHDSVRGKVQLPRGK